MSYTRSAVAIITSLWLVGAGAAWAQTTTTDKSTMGADKKSTMSMDMSGRHSMTGQITSLDEKKGWVHVKTPEGTMIMQAPPSSLQGLKKGDTVTVDLAMKTEGRAK